MLLYHRELTCKTQNRMVSPFFCNQNAESRVRKRKRSMPVVAIHRVDENMFFNWKYVSVGTGCVVQFKPLARSRLNI